MCLLLLDTGNHIWSLAVSSDRTWSDLEKWNSCTFEGLYCVKERKLCRIFLRHTNRKPHTRSPTAPFHWPWVTLKCQSHAQSDCERLYLVITYKQVPHRGVCGRAGFSAVSAVFLGSVVLPRVGKRDSLHNCGGQKVRFSLKRSCDWRSF